MWHKTHRQLYKLTRHATDLCLQFEITCYELPATSAYWAINISIVLIINTSKQFNVNFKSSCNKYCLVNFWNTKSKITPQQSAACLGRVLPLLPLPPSLSECPRQRHAATCHSLASQCLLEPGADSHTHSGVTLVWKVGDQARGVLIKWGVRPHSKTWGSGPVPSTGGSKGAGRGHAPPPRRVGKHPECTKSRHFQTQNRKNFLGRGIFWGGGNAPSPEPS